MFLTDSIFDSSAYDVPSKLQNLTVLGRGGTWCSHPRIGHAIGTISYPPFWHSTQNHLALDFYIMVATTCSSRVWTTWYYIHRWTTLTQNSLVLWFTWYFICTSFKSTAHLSEKELHIRLDLIWEVEMVDPVYS